MKKIFPFLIAIAILAGCSSKVLKPSDMAKNIDNTFSDSIELATRLNSGVLYVLLSIEVNSNISSLVIDKTKEKVVGFHSKAYEVLPKGRVYYILPTRITREGKTYFDEENARLIQNYIILSEFGRVTDNIQNADYIIVSRINESIERSYATNRSTAVLNIMTKKDLPVFASLITLESKSDINFWYYPTKRAIPANILSMKALGQIFAVALPNAYGIPTNRLDEFEQNLKKNKEERQAAKEQKAEEKNLAEMEKQRDQLKVTESKVTESKVTEPEVPQEEK